jgi:long-chain acyl-CoA synthetase
MKNFRTFDLIDFAIEKYSSKNDILAGKVNNKWEKYSAKEYKHFADRISIGLLELGMKKGDKIATVSNNRPEWNFFDMGISQINAVHTPIYPTLTNEDFEFILKHSEAVMLIVSDKLLYKKLKPIVDKIKKIKHFYTFNDIEGAKNWREIYELGSKKYEKNIEKLNKIKEQISADELVTLIYTSGTTANPKGVMLTHRNFTYQVDRFKYLIDLGPEDKSLSFLPLCHVLERIVNYAMQYLGISIYYAEGFHKLADNLSEVKPSVFATVPRVIERFYDKIVSKGELLPSVKKKIFFAALNHAEKFDFTGKNPFYKAMLNFYDNLVFSQWRKAFGGKIKYIISGGAALSPRLNRIFWAAGMPIREGYGLTETAPVICLNNLPPDGIKFGTVGKKIGDEQEVKIADDGEILFKGPNLMLGYYKAPDLTKEAIDEQGWFHTGDLGQLDEQGFLKITGRKKEIFKLSNGKYISPAIIENMFIESALIEQMMVVGENEKFAGALISPNFEALHAFAAEQNITYRNNEELVKNPAIYTLLKKEVISLNKKLAQYERINTFRIVCEEWTPANGELSPTLKKRRHVIKAKYAHLIKEMYS